MAILHFLNVNDGDCSIIKHNSGHITVIDVCNAKEPTLSASFADYWLRKASLEEKGINGNFNQRKYPVNPIIYMQEQGYSSVFRFILTHPDMDHMDGMKAFFEAFSPINFWDTDNTCEKHFSQGSGRYNEDDWNFYAKLRDEKPDTNPKRLTLHSDDRAQYFNVGADGSAGGDGLFILAPTPKLVADANSCEDFNDCSYVILYKTRNHRILFAGDSHDTTWEHILKNHKKDVTDVDLLIAPHHGRHSDRDWEFLDVVNPALTLFGNADSEHLAYAAWSNRGLPIITNNQAGCVIIDCGTDPMGVYVTCEAFAKKFNPYVSLDGTHKGYYIGTIARKIAVGA